VLDEVRRGRHVVGGLGDRELDPVPVGDRAAPRGDLELDDLLRAREAPSQVARAPATSSRPRKIANSSPMRRSVRPIQDQRPPAAGGMIDGAVPPAAVVVAVAAAGAMVAGAAAAGAVVAGAVAATPVDGVVAAGAVPAGGVPADAVPAASALACGVVAGAAGAA
jgi:hypothetical protein